MQRATFSASPLDLAGLARHAVAILAADYWPQHFLLQIVERLGGGRHQLVNQRSRMSSEFSIISEVDIRAAPTPMQDAVASGQPPHHFTIFATQHPPNDTDQDSYHWRCVPGGGPGATPRWAHGQSARARPGRVRTQRRSPRRRQPPRGRPRAAASPWQDRGILPM